jgi:hypothetical protein
MKLSDYSPFNKYSSSAIASFTYNSIFLLEFNPLRRSGEAEVSISLLTYPTHHQHQPKPNETK